MRSSLKGYTPALARLLGMTPAALYERQRALVRAGMLDPGEGRGPGSGVRTHEGSVALLMIAALATESLSETEERTREIASASPVGNELCPITLTKTFFEALASVLSMKDRSDAVLEISVSRTAALAHISFQNGARTAEFAGSQSAEPGLRVVASLAREPFQAIAGDMHALLEESFIEAISPADGSAHGLDLSDSGKLWDRVLEKAGPPASSPGKGKS
jgi:hypothetical protein